MNDYEKKGARGAVIIAFLLGFLFGAVFAIKAHSAEPQSAVIEFTSAEDLRARVDSVTAVCDPVSEKYWTWEEYAKANYDSVAWNGSVWVAYTRWDTTIYSTLPKSITSNWWPATTRCRKLVGAMKYSDPTREPTGTIIATFPTQVEMRTVPGTAIVWWEWKKITEGGKR